MEIAPEIEKAIKTRQLVLFIGAGYSSSEPLNLPDWRKLIKLFVEDIQTTGSHEVIDNIIAALNARVIDEIRALDLLNEHGFRERCINVLKKYIDINYAGIDMSKFKKLWEISDKIMTTNYDCAIENCKAGVLHFTYTDKERMSKLYNSEQYLFKIHGSILNPNECVLFRDTYEGLYRNNRLVIKELSDLFSHKTILFIGFGLTDPYITDILQDLQQLYEGNKGKHYVLTTKDEDFSKYDVETIKLLDWKELDVYLDKLVSFRNSINYSFEELIKELDSKGIIYDRDEVQMKHENYLKSLYNDNNNTELTKFIETGQYKEAEKLLENSIDEKLRRVDLENQSIAQEAFKLAGLKELQYELKDALVNIKQAHDLHPDNVIYLKNYCSSLLESGLLKESKHYTEYALSLDNLSDADVIEFKILLGRNLIELGKYDDALETFNEIIELETVLYGPKHPITIGSYNNVGSALRNLGKYKEAIDIYEKGVKELTDISSIYLPETLSLFYSNLSVAWSSLAWAGDHALYKNALGYAEQALEIRIQHSRNPDKSIQVALAYNHVGLAKKRLGDNKQAIFYYNKAIDIVIDIYSETHPRYIDFNLNLAAAFRADDRAHDAINLLEKIIPLAKNVFGELHPKLGQMYINLGFSYATIEDYKTAVSCYEKGLPIVEKNYGKNHPNMQIFINNYTDFKNRI